MRAWTASACLALTTVAPAGGILVLITPSDAGPNVDPRSYIHPTWVRWPAAAFPGGGNRLLSVKTGADWLGDPRDLGFVAKDNGFIATNHARMVERGVFDLGPGFDLDAMNRGPGARAAMLLALRGTSAVVRPGSGSRAVASVRSWDEAAALRRRYGRALVLEWPPSRGNLGRYWLDGEPVPGSAWTPVPGLLAAREIGSVLDGPRPARGGSPLPFGGADRLSASAERYGPRLLGGAFLAAVLILVAGLRATARERRAPLVATAIRLLLALFPAAFLAGSAIQAGAGDGSLVVLLVWPPIAILIAQAAERTLKAPRFTGDAVLALATCVAGGVEFSPLSRSFAPHPYFVAPEVLAVGLAAVTTLAGTVPLLRLLPLALAVWTSTTDHPLGLLPLLSLLALAPVRWSVLALPQTAPLQILVRHGAAWKPEGLVHTVAEIPLWSAAGPLLAVLSPGFGAVAALAAVLAGASGPFLVRQLRRALRDERAASAARLTLVSALAGILVPEAMAVVPVLAMHALLILVLTATELD